jgi:endonuclease YncB( thermonuclease family)
MGCKQTKERSADDNAPDSQQPAAGGKLRRVKGAQHVGSDDHGVKHYAELPMLYEKATCHHVYDGDTLTLTDRRRVRFLGIDTPEVKEKQPFAEEAKQYTKTLCDRKEIFLVYGDKREDHYGRVLAHIYVKIGDGERAEYLCVNEGLVDAGLAGYYSVAGEELANQAELLSLQTKARAGKRGKWSQFRDMDVNVTTHGRCFHAAGCKHQANSRKVEKVKMSQALDKGLSACRECLSEL